MDNIQKIYIINFLRMAFLAGAITIPFYQEWGGLNFTAIFVLQMIFYFVMASMQIPTGVFADKYGRKTAIVFGAFLLIISVLAYVSMPSYPVFILGEILWAVAVVSISGADSAMIYETLREQKKLGQAKQVFANAEIANSIGMIVAFPIGSTLAGMLAGIAPENYRIVFALNALIYAAMAAVSLTLKEPKHFKKTDLGWLKHAKNGLNEIIKNKLALAYVLDMAFVGTASFMVFWVSQPLYRGLGIPILYWGFIAAFSNIINIALLKKLGFLEKKLGAGNLLKITGAGCAIAFLLIYFVKNPIVAVASVLAIASLSTIRYPVFQDLLNRLIKSKNRATALSASSMFSDGSRFLAYPFIGMLADYSIDLTFLFLGAAIVASMAISGGLYNRAKNGKPA